MLQKMKKANDNTDKLIEKIDDLLPQTQCGLCGYAGCKPYAKAIINDDTDIDACLPGGVTTLQALGECLQREYNSKLAAMRDKQKPRMLAKIDETLCIGCTKCIAACPVDAILGSAKLMHTVISNACTGCELCVTPCPMDCIEMQIIEKPLTKHEQQVHAESSRNRFNQRQSRLQAQKHYDAKKINHKKIDARKTYINDAIQRVKMKKLNKDFDTI